MRKSTVFWTRSAGIGVAALIGLAALTGVTGCAQPELKSELKEIPQGLKGTNPMQDGEVKANAENRGGNTGKEPQN